MAQQYGFLTLFHRLVGAAAVVVAMVTPVGCFQDDDAGMGGSGTGTGTGTAATGSSTSMTGPGTSTSGTTMGSTAGTTMGPVEPPPAPMPMVTVAPVKRFRFQWPPAPGAAGLRLLEDPDGQSGFTEIEQLPGDTTDFDLEVYLPRRLGATYAVEACNPAGCTPSDPLPIGGKLVPAIGYVKAENADGGDEFGWNVALSADGQTLAVAAIREDSGNGPNDNGLQDAGAVYVYVHTDTGTWAAQAYLKAPSTAAGSLFGYALELSSDGNVLAVGDPDEASVNGGEGAVHVFVRTGDTWNAADTLTAPNAGTGDRFGRSVGISGSGDRIVVGAPSEDSAATGVNGNGADNTVPDAGAAYVFERQGATWGPVAYLKASNTGGSDLFGGRVAISGDGKTVAVGAHREDSDASGIDGDDTNDNLPQSGAVYVFEDDGGWAQAAYVKAPNPGQGDQFGRAVTLSLDGTTLVVGAPQEDSDATGIDGDGGNDAASDAGAVYVYVRQNGSWAFQTFIKALNTGTGDRFGASVALAGGGGQLVVGAPGEDGGVAGVGADASDESAQNAGAVYLYDRIGQTWMPLRYVKAPNPGADDEFGIDVSLSGDGATLAVGAWHEDGSATGIGGSDNDAKPDAGAAYLY